MIKGSMWLLYSIPWIWTFWWHHTHPCQARACSPGHCQWLRIAQSGLVPVSGAHWWRCRMLPLHKRKIWKEGNVVTMMDYLWSFPLHVGDELLQKSGSIHLGSNPLHFSLIDDIEQLQSLLSYWVFLIIATDLIVEKVAEGCGILEDESSDWEEGKQKHVDLSSLIQYPVHCTCYIMTLPCRASVQSWWLDWSFIYAVKIWGNIQIPNKRVAGINKREF